MALMVCKAVLLMEEVTAKAMAKQMESDKLIQESKIDGTLVGRDDVWVSQRGDEEYQIFHSMRL